MIYLLKFLSTLIVLWNMHNPVLSKKIYSAENQFPYFVGIKYVDEPEKVLCGGAIINERFVLTAANCVAIYREPQYLLQVLAGTNHIEKYSINKIIVHEDYFKNKSEPVVLNDIALLETQTAFNFNKGMLPIKIASETILLGSNVTKIGYEITKDGVDTYPKNFLQYVEMKVEHNLVCYQYSKYEAGLLCLRHLNDKGTCCSWGSGGPVVHHTLDGITLIGITSYDKSYCGSCNPDSFVSVLYFAEWIFNKISE